MEKERHKRKLSALQTKLSLRLALPRPKTLLKSRTLDDAFILPFPTRLDFSFMLGIRATSIAFAFLCLLGSPAFAQMDASDKQLLYEPR